VSTVANRFFVGWRNWLAQMIPNWQTRRPGLETGFRFLWSIVVQFDVLLELALQGVNDAAPGEPNATPTALPIIARSRGLIQGEAETNDHFALRLQNWRTNGLAVAPPAVPQVWTQRGQTEKLALQIQNFLGNTPTVRIIERLYNVSGPRQALYTTAAPDGTTSTAVANWDWDSVSGWTDDTSTYAGAAMSGWWSDFWVVIDPGTYTRGTSITPLTGQEVPSTSHDSILQILKDWKGGYTFCRAIIWNYVDGLFDPANPSLSGNPDGTWGNWSKILAGNQVPARNILCRYWIPPRG
jgi:hypothetical protein